MIKLTHQISLYNRQRRRKNARASVSEIIYNQLAALPRNLDIMHLKVKATFCTFSLISTKSLLFLVNHPQNCQ